MSDFDKEAEREKLREKYGNEEQKREATEQMSELLLKGATMTNAHCTDCGDPIFRYDGQEFCPTCQKPVARDQSDGETAGDDHIEVADPSDDAHVQFGGDDADATADTDGQSTADATADTPQQPAAEAQPSADTPQQPAAADRSVPSADPDRTPPTASEAADSPERAPTATPSRPEPPARTADRSVDSDLSAAQELLAETVTRFAQQAAETEDPRRARDHLAAAREAAEALDAVRF